MRRLRLPFGKAVQIYWLDSASMSGWRGNSEPRVIGKIVSLGYVTRVSELGVSLTTSIHTDKQSMDDITIPWGCIVDLKKVGEGWDRV